MFCNQLLYVIAYENPVNASGLPAFVSDEWNTQKNTIEKRYWQPVNKRIFYPRWFAFFTCSSYIVREDNMKLHLIHQKLLIYTVFITGGVTLVLLSYAIFCRIKQITPECINKTFECRKTWNRIDLETDAIYRKEKSSRDFLCQVR